MNFRGLACALLLLAVPGCSPNDDKSPHYGTTTRHGKPLTTFYVNNLGEPEYVDPGKAHDTTSSKLINHIFEGLTTYGPDGKPIAGVANRYARSADNRFWRFHLRDDARWSDGKPVTASDFEYSMKRVIDPKTASQSASNLYALKNAELVNQGKLKVLTADSPLYSADAPRPTGVESSKTLPKGTALLVLAESPVKVETKLAPLGELPAGLLGISYDKADGDKTPEVLTLLGDKQNETRGPTDSPLAPGDYDIAEDRGAIVCNGQPDRLYALVARDGSGRGGVFAGCMLGASKVDTKRALVALHTDLPTFVERPLAPTQKALPIGFVDLAKLASDTSILGVRTVDERTIEFELAYPAPYLPDMLCSATAAPVRRDLVEKFPGDPDRWTRPENIITNGPYQIDTWRFRYEIRTKRNPHHRLHDKLKIHEIVWMSVESLVSGMNLFKAGELDYIGDNGSLPPNYIPSLRQKQDFRVTNYLATYWYELNTRKPPLNDVRVRRALNLAIDKKQLVDKVMLGGQLPASHFTPPYARYGYSEQHDEEEKAGTNKLTGPGTQFDPELARKLLGEAGFPVVGSGDNLRAEGMAPIEVLYNTSEGHKKVAVAIQDMWRRHLGVSITLRNEEWKVMLKNVRDGNFQVVRFGWVGDYSHPQTFMDTFMSDSPNNRTGWGNGRFDQLVMEARSTGDPTRSMLLYRQAEAVLVEEVPKIPLYFYTKATLIKPYVKGFFPNERNEQLIHYMWIDENWKAGGENVPAFSVEKLPEPETFSP